MFDRLIFHWRARRERRALAEYEDGYGVVMMDYFLHGTSLQDIDFKIDDINWGEPITETERGMLEARRRLSFIHRDLCNAIEVLDKIEALNKPGFSLWSRYGRKWRDQIHSINLALRSTLNDY